MPRICYHADESYWDKEAKKYLLIQVTEGEHGYRVAARHESLEAAQAVARDRNASLNLSEEDVLDIRASSMLPFDPRAEITVWRVSAARVDAIAGRQLSAEELDDIGDAIANSTAMDSVQAAVDQVAPRKEDSDG